MGACTVVSGAEPPDLTTEARVGKQLFAEQRFAQYFAAHCNGKMNAHLVGGDPGLNPADPSKPGVPTISRQATDRTMSCATCHFASESTGRPVNRLRTFSDGAERSPVPTRSDNRRTTPRHTPPLVDLLPEANGPGLLHYDGEFATPEDLVIGTYTGRNFGWLPGEQAEARQHFARVIREDDRAGTLGEGSVHISYATLMRGTDPTIPSAFRLPESFRFEPAKASDDEILRGCAKLVVAYLRSLHFSRDADGQFNGSPYDAFLAANRLPRAPKPGETPPEYNRRLGEGVAALRAPHYIDEPDRKLRLHDDQPFRFGELELRGLRIFFRSAIGKAQANGTGNCAECHVPPHFTDFSFHNTGVAQGGFDGIQGAGAFANLTIPSLPTRSADYDRWLQATPQHPKASGVFLSPVATNTPDRADLGLWNVYANPDIPSAQVKIEHLMNRNDQLKQNEVLALTVGRFKTPSIRDLGQSGPYLHTGQAHNIEEVIAFYQRMSALAHEGKLRNAPPEFFEMRLDATDIAPLAAFLRALNEDYDGTNGSTEK